MLAEKFPILKRKINRHRLVYLDNASTTQKPQEVIEAVSSFYRRHNANVHRRVYQLSLEATKLFEEARDKVRAFINAPSRQEVVFTSGATEAINLAAASWGSENIRRGDEILLTDMEHHSNLVPWLMLTKKKGAKLKFLPIDRQGRLKLSLLPKFLTAKTKLFALTHASNVLGTINPVTRLARLAHKKGAKVLVDGAQAGGHLPIDVQKLDCDFYVLSGHKMYGPSGVGVLFGKKQLLEAMPPYQTGGHMIKAVTKTSATWDDLPHKFEAGTANIAQAIGLAAAIDFINTIGLKKIAAHESVLLRYALQQMTKIPQIDIYGPKASTERLGVISFNVQGLPPHDLASLLDEYGIALRTGHHCTMPLHQVLGIESSARITFGIYNTLRDIDEFLHALKRAQQIFLS